MIDKRLTHSQMQCAKTCLRKHQLAYVFGIRREVESIPMRIGSAFHFGLNLKANGESANSAVLGTMVQFDSTKPITDDDRLYHWMIDREIIARLLSAYFWRWAEADAGIKIIGSEVAFNVSISNPATGHPMRIFRRAGKHY